MSALSCGAAQMQKDDAALLVPYIAITGSCADIFQSYAGVRVSGVPELIASPLPGIAL